MQTSLFDFENRYASLSAAGAPLERLNAAIDWEIFRPVLYALSRPRTRRQGSDDLPHFLGAKKAQHFQLH